MPEGGLSRGSATFLSGVRTRYPRRSPSSYKGVPRQMYGFSQRQTLTPFSLHPLIIATGWGKSSWFQAKSHPGVPYRLRCFSQAESSVITSQGISSSRRREMTSSTSARV